MEKYRKLINSSEVNEYNETNDCTVISLSIVLDTNYTKVHNALELVGRKKGKGIKLRQSLIQLGRLLDFEFERFIPIQNNGSKYTMKTIGNKYNKGNYLVFVSGHVAAMIDGTIEDWTINREHRVVELIKITNTTLMSL